MSRLRAQDKLYTRFAGTAEGLSQGTNYSFLRDAEQFLWISSEDGINRYDGRNFVTYYMDENRTGSPVGVTFVGIVEDSTGNIWIGSDKALNKYQRLTDSFIAFHTNEKRLQRNNFTVPFQYKEQYIYYFKANNGILRRHIHTHLVDTLFSFQSNLSDYRIYQYTRINASNELIIPFKYGIGLVNLQNKQVRYFHSDHASNVYGTPLTVYCLQLDKDPAKIWLGTNKGLVLLNTKTGQSDYFPLPTHDEDKEILSIELDSNNLYIGTAASGPYIFHLATKRYEKMVVDNEDFQFRGQQIYGAYKDPQGILWFNLNPSGIISVSTKFQKFNKQSLHDQRTDETEVIRSFTNTPDDHLWIGTQGAGIFVKNKDHDKPVNFESQYGIQLPSPWIRHLLTEQDVTHIATETGLYTFEHQKKRLHAYTLERTDNQELFVHQSLVLNDSTLLVATNRGPYIANKRDRSLKALPFLKNENISYLFQALNGDIYFNIWEGGMAVYKPNNWELLKTIFPSIALLGAWQDPSSGNIYFATNAGLLETTSNHQIVKNYTLKDGLSNNFIYGILSDADRNLWLSTNKGLSVFNLQRKTFKNFGPEDGLQGNEYNGKSYYKDPAGYFYFGGTAGYDCFNPSLITDFNYHVNIYIKQLSVNNIKQVSPLYFNEPYKITLKPTQNTFSVILAVTDFFNNKENAITYKLENFDKEWVLGTANTIIRYAQLPPGEYVFRYKGANKDGLWSKYEKSIILHIATPYYATWWFILLIVMAIAVLLYAMYKYRVNQLLRLERLKTSLSNDLHDDVGASLSAINIYAKMAETKQEKDTYIQLIKTNSLQALDSINAMVWAIKPESQKLNTLFLRMKDFALPFLEGKGINCVFIVHNHMADINLSPDFAKNFYLLFKEGINNVARHSCCVKTVIRIHIQKQILTLTIEDNGKGFVLDEARTNGNGLRTMEERCKAFNGELHIQSIPNEGTLLIIKVALKNTTL